MATKTKTPQADDVTLKVTFRRDGTVFIPQDELVSRAGTALEILQRSKLAVEEVNGHLGVTDLQAAISWVDAERFRLAEHSRNWDEYVRYRDEKKRAADEARQEAARKAREEEEQRNRRRMRKLGEELQRKREQEAARRAAEQAERDGRPVPFESFSEQAS